MREGEYEVQYQGFSTHQIYPDHSFRLVLGSECNNLGCGFDGVATIDGEDEICLHGSGLAVEESDAVENGTNIVI